MRTSVLAATLAIVAAMSFAGGALAITPAIVSSGTHTLALDENGLVYAWGSDTQGQLGQGRNVIRPTPTRVNGLPVIKHFAVYRHVLAVDTFGEVWSWGDGSCGQLGPRASGLSSKPARVSGVSGMTKAAAGLCFSLALKSDGTVWGWGAVPGFDSSVAPGIGVRQVPGLTGITEIAAGDTHALALKSDGTVYAFGTNGYGELGLGAAGSSQPPTLIPGLTGVTAIEAGYFSSLALSSGAPRIWGLTPAGTPAAAPTAMTALGGTAIAIGVSGSVVYAVRSDGLAFQYIPFSQSWFALGFSGIAKFASGYDATYGINATGQLFARGNNYAGQLGQGNTTDLLGPLPVPGFAATSRVRMAALTPSVLALKTDGSLWFWGQDTVGQSGDGAVSGSSVPLYVPIPKPIESISVNDGISIAVDIDGNAWGWGDNSTYSLSSSRVNRSTPAIITGVSGVASAAAGASFVLYAITDGTVWISGSASPLPFSTVPAPIAGLTNIVSVAAGPSGYAVDASGRLYAFGDNQYGQLGIGAAPSTATPVQVTGITGFVTGVSTGGATYRVGAVTSNGKAWTWGDAPLGNGTSGTSNVPVQVPGVVDAAQISVGASAALVRRQAGGLLGWGTTKLLDATGINTLLPYPIAFYQPVQDIATGGSPSFLVGATGLVWGFGSSSLAQQNATLGDGTYVFRNRPVVVLRDGGLGSLDTNDWYLDLQPATPETIPAGSIPTQLAVSRLSGGGSGIAIGGTVKYMQRDLGKRVNNFVLGLVPPAFFNLVKTAPGAASAAQLSAKLKKDGVTLVLAQLTPAGWTNVQGQLIAYSQGVATGAGGATNILDGINTTLIPGARFCVGYGETADSMLNAQALSEVLVLEGASGTASNVPCVISGVYVDGPPASTLASPVTFNASVVGLSPTGNVQFKDGFATLGLPIAISTSNPAVGRATITTSSLALGAHSIGATYAGDVQNPAATVDVPRTHVVTAPLANTQVDLSGPASSELASEVAFSVTILGNNPTGNVQFKDGASNIGAAVPVINAMASIRVSTLGLGSHSITAAYAGDGSNAAGTSPTLIHLVVNVLSASVALASNVNPSNTGSPVTLTATVTGSNPTGAVMFKDGAALFATVPLNAGVATIVVSAFIPGVHYISAVYGGDANNPSVSSDVVFQQVNLVLDPTTDFDGDGIPNTVEVVEGSNPLLKDNNIFGNARFFAMQQYRDFLNREGDAGGIASWTAFINGGGTRATMVEGFFASAEFQGVISPVTRLYFAYFLRIPDYDGLQFWINYFRAGNPLAAISNAFAASGEFTSRYGALTNDQFVDLVYQNVLGRAADAGGKTFWLGQLNGGMTRGAMMIGFSESAEFIASSRSKVNVTMTYIGMLRRAPDTGGFNFWVGYIDTGNSQQALINGFLAAPEYRLRFLP